jgi:hypothetical protein
LCRSVRLWRRLRRGSAGRAGAVRLVGPAGAVPGIEGPAHPSEDLQLLYVGLARSGPSSKTWARHPEPWTVEAAVIEQLQPPLNQADNRDHPLYRYVRDARWRWRAAAKEGGPPEDRDLHLAGR